MSNVPTDPTPAPTPDPVHESIFAKIAGTIGHDVEDVKNALLSLFTRDIRIAETLAGGLTDLVKKVEGGAALDLLAEVKALLAKAGINLP